MIPLFVKFSEHISQFYSHYSAQSTYISINRLCRVFIIEQLLTLSVSNTACTFSNAICSLGSPLPARCSFLIRNKRSSVCARSANASSRLISSASRTGSTDQMLMAIFIYDSHNIQPKVFIQQCIFMSIIKNIEVRWKKQNSFRNIALTSSINMDHIFVFEASYNVYNCV